MLGVLAALPALAYLRGFTVDAAYASRDESEVGQLAPGMRADFVILVQDPLAVPVGQMDELQIQSTWVDGERVFEAE